jgi:5-formyltetrahydrofolate cyclo-ligase
MNKENFREHCLKKIKKSNNKSRLYKKLKINKNLLILLKELKSKRILFYYPMKMEADITPTIRKVRKKSTIFLPFIIDVSFKMVKFRLPMTKNRFGIYEPRNSNYYKRHIDAAIIPTIGVDGSFKRVGFGKGMYDRFFSKKSNKPTMIFLQNEECYTNKIVCEAFDIKADFYITPQKILRVPSDRNNSSIRANVHNKRSYRVLRSQKIL